MAQFYDQPTRAPTRKITYAGALGAPLAGVLTIAAWHLGIQVPADVASALGALIAAVVGYLVRERV